jgi:hypothetical protein
MGEKTIVIFRKWPKSQGGEVIALFPCEAATRDGGMCQSYERVGQHGAADPHGVVDRTKPATPEEYAELKAELERAPYGYALEVRSRIPWDANDRRHGWA